MVNNSIFQKEIIMNPTILYAHPLNGLLCGQKCVIPVITVEKPNLSMEKLKFITGVARRQT